MIKYLIELNMKHKPILVLRSNIGLYIYIFVMLIYRKRGRGSIGEIGPSKVLFCILIIVDNYCEKHVYALCCILTHFCSFKCMIIFNIY